MLEPPNPYVAEQLKLLQRDINCIIDQDRNLRKQGLLKIKDFLKAKDNQREKVQLFDAYILRNLLRGFEDPVEKHRELAIAIVDSYLLLHSDDFNFEVMKQILEAVISRLNQLPFVEQSEELRLQLVKLLQTAYKHYHECLRDSLPQLAHMLSKLLQDNFPEVKREAAFFAATVSRDYALGDYMGDAIKALNLNMQHAHAKVRKATVESLASIVLSRKNGSFLDLTLKNLSNLTLDKSSDVRKSALLAIAELLTHFSVQNLNNFENQLILMLLNGLSDDSKEIQQLTLGLLDQVGAKRKLLDAEANL